MNDWKVLSHVKWECKYHVVMVPKYRMRLIYGRLKREIGPVLRELFRQKGVEVLEGYAMADHVHVCVSVPPKLSISEVIGFVKGKSAIQIHRRYLGRKQNFTGFHFWSRGYCVSTVGRDEQMIREYIKSQESEERREEAAQLSMLEGPSGPKGGVRGPL
ncbi:MAG: IS200/IS605 family transposase [Bdellovibrionales bacterium]|nr:IS200/IS605 family transposase [Bdellovibrionales bacterium]